MTHFARIDTGREKWEAHAAVGRHRHDRGYAAVVLSGGYEECGSRGRFRVGAGDVLLHGAFDSHLNRFAPGETEIVNIVLAPLELPAMNVGRVADADDIARVAEADPAAAAGLLRGQLAPFVHPLSDWPDMLAADLLQNPQCRIDAWARAHGLAGATVSRGFRKVFGLSPAAFRAQARAQAAFARIVESHAPLAAIAAATGFADQAHMSRATRALTGKAPAQWRRSNPFKTAGQRAA